jgi:tRNA A-37 threonylcarbamoyl transferase component Bud32
MRREKLRQSVFLMLMVLASAGSMAAQQIHPLAQQWVDKRIERAQTDFLRRSWQISDAEYRNRIKNIDAEIRQITTEVQRQAPDLRNQIRQDSDSLYKVRIAPLQAQWQKQTADRDKSIRAGIAADAEQAGKMQAQRQSLQERLQQGEISQADFSRQDRELEQNVIALQNKWNALDPRWGTLFTQSWQRVQTATMRSRQTRVTPNNPDLQDLVNYTVAIRHNEFLYDKQAISLQEEQERNAQPLNQMLAIQRKYSGDAAKDFNSRADKLIDEKVRQLRPQWEAEVRKLSAGSPPSPATTPVSSPTPPPPPPPSPSRNPAGAGSGGPAKSSKVYLSEMPRASRVMEGISGKDQAQTVSCQIAALATLRDVIYIMNGMNSADENRSRLTPEEQRLDAEYTAARTNLLQANPGVNVSGVSPGFRNDVVWRFFSPVSTVYSNVYNPNVNAVPCDSATPDSRAGGSDESSGSSLVLPAAILLALGGAGYLLYRRRPHAPPAAAPAPAVPARTAPAPKPNVAPSRPVSVAAADDQPTIRREKTAGDFILGRKLGSGGFGSVFEARHKETQLPYAVKRIALSIDDAERFRKEALYPARIAAKSLHVITVHSFFQDSDEEYFYLVTELIPHGDLRDFLERSPKPLPIKEALDLALGIARGLAAIHEQGVAHLDLKPRNILMDRKDDQWIPKIADFGLARSSGSRGLNQSASPGYAAPEQLDWSQEPGPKSDLFSFGMIFYELLTGKKVTDAGNANEYIEWLRQRRIPAPPSVLRPELEKWPAIDSLVQGLLQYDHKMRTASAAEVVRTLADILQDVH